ncbi:MAG: hypothetical protein GXP39_05345 [Chloroflexi bacterium]|nr:hypothetical protein [Chloroflexota bacterium]
MYRRLWRHMRGEEGQSLVVIALAMVALLGMASLAIDGGYAYAQHRRMQNAADLAALAGARALGMGRTASEIDQEINYYAQANGASSVSYYFIDANGQPVATPDQARGVHVNTQTTFNTFLAAVVGINQLSASAESEAELYGLGGASNLLPIAVHEDNFQYLQVYELWDDNHEAPGAFGWIDWDGGGGGLHELADNIANPSNSGYWRVGDLVPAEPGVKAGAPVRNALNLWKNRNITLIIYNQVTGQGSNTRYTISGFGEFVLTDYRFQGPNKRIWGYFIRRVTAGEPGGPEFGLQGVRLRE